MKDSVVETFEDHIENTSEKIEMYNLIQHSKETPI